MVMEQPDQEFTGLTTKQIKWLNKSFMRDQLDSQEQGYLCMFPLWNGNGNGNIGQAKEEGPKVPEGWCFGKRLRDLGFHCQG